MKTTTKKSISPTMKLLKRGGFIRITYRRSYSYRERRFVEVASNKGHFSYMKGTRDYFTLECMEIEPVEDIFNYLNENGVKVEKDLGFLRVYY